MMLCDKIEKSGLPFFIAVAGDEWVAEEKMDGDRIRLEYKDRKVKLVSRGKSGDVTMRYPELEGFNHESNLVLDGEMCVIDDNGVSQFNEGISFRTHCTTLSSVQLAARNYPVTYVVFDVLEKDGQDLRELDWDDRREILESLNLDHNRNVKVIGYSRDILAKWDEVEKKGGEGIILKKRTAPYLEGRRSSAWKKVKNIKEEDLVFVKYSVNNAGIRIETEDEIAIQVSGRNAPPVQRLLDDFGKATITIRHLGWTGKKFRQPTYCKIVEN